MLIISATGNDKIHHVSVTNGVSKKGPSHSAAPRQNGGVVRLKDKLPPLMGINEKSSFGSGMEKTSVHYGGRYIFAICKQIFRRQSNGPVNNCNWPAPAIHKNDFQAEIWNWEFFGRCAQEGNFNDKPGPIIGKLNQLNDQRNRSGQSSNYAEDERCDLHAMESESKNPSSSSDELT